MDTAPTRTIQQTVSPSGPSSVTYNCYTTSAGRGRSGFSGRTERSTACSFSTFSVKLLEELFCLSFMVTFSLSLLLSFCHDIFNMKMVYSEDHIR